MNLKSIGLGTILAGSAFFSGCVAPIGGGQAERVVRHTEKKNGEILAQGIFVVPLPRGFEATTTRTYIDGGSRISPPTPDGIVDELILRAPSGKYTYTRTSYAGPDGVVHDLRSNDSTTVALRERTLDILNNATEQYRGYGSFLQSIGK